MPASPPRAAPRPPRAEVPAQRAPAERATALLDGLLSWLVAGLAWWTTLFHVALPLRWHRDVVAAIWLAGLAGLAAAAVLLALRRRRGHRRALVLRPVTPRVGWHVPVLVAVAVAACALSATRWPDERPQWWVFWSAVVVIAGCAVAVAARARPAPAHAARPPRSRAAPAPAAVAAVAGLALLAALGSAFTQRPDADDVFLVNRSTYVAENPGPLPERDTLFSDEVFAVTRPDTVPTSFEALVGSMAAWVGLSAPTVTYLLVGPAVAAAAVLALWRMLRTLGAVAPAAATVAAGAFLLLDGGVHYTHGNFHFARAWQGKVLFLIVVIPALWHHALRWARDGSRRDLALLLASNVAAIGLTTTAAFVAPSVTAVAVVAGAWAAGAWYRLWPALLTAVPPLLGALAFTALPRQDPALGDRAAESALPVLAWLPPWFTLTGGINPGRQWHWIFDGGIGLLVPAAAALTAWAFVTDRAARLGLALAPLLLFGLFYGPGTFDAIADLTEVRAILWRTGWILPVPAAVGIALTAPLLLAPSTRQRLLAAAVPAAVLVAMAIGSTWVLHPDNMGMHVGRLAWDVDPDDRVAAQRLVDLSDPGDAILAPERVGGVVAIQTTRVRAVNPRGQYMTGRHAVPEFRGEQRQLAAEAVTIGVGAERVGELAEAVRELDVATACVAAHLDSPPVDVALARAGLERVDADHRCTYWRR